MPRRPYAARPSHPERHERDELEVRDGAAKFVCVADTHSAPHPAALARIAAERPDAILHLGDIGDLRVLPPLAEIAPLFAVRGNIDGASLGDPPDHRTLTLTQDGAPIARWLLTHIAVRGPRLSAPIRALAQRVEAQLVVCGHSHVPFLGVDQGVGVFNPGSIGPRRFQLPIVFGVITLADRRLSFRHVDCETGADWRPAG